MKRPAFGTRARLVCATSVALAAAATVASTAGATTLIPAQASCASVAVSQPFASWGDSNEYDLVPGGSFSGSTAGWTFSGGAQVVSAQLPFDLTGSAATTALYLPPGASAQSPYVCVDAADPTYRFVSRGTGSGSTVAAQAVYKGALGVQVPLTLGIVPAPSAWAPTAQLYTGAAPVSLLSGGTAEMSLKFTAGASGAYIDDVFVDPRMHG